MILEILVLVAVSLAYFLNQYCLSYWSRNGISQLNPIFLFGDAYSMITVKAGVGEFFATLYQKYKHKKLFGIYFSYKSVLVVTDPKIAQNILIRDFSSFHDRPMPVNEECDPISAHLFNVRGQTWRDMRVKLSPAFTSGKLKTMLPVIKDCGQVLQDYIAKNIMTGTKAFEFRDLTARYTTNVISSVAFGIDNDCINEPDHIFRRMGAKFFEPSLWNGIRNAVFFMFPSMYHKLGFRQTTGDVEKFLFSIVKQTVEYREKNNYSRNDMMQMLIQLKNQGYVSVDKDADPEEAAKTKTVTKLTMGQLTAQVFVFFVAGFETSSSTMSLCLFELARNPELQKKVQAEIDKVFQSNSKDEVTYEMYGALKYLECCIDETLRLYPNVPALFREAARDYKVPDTDITIPKGSPVFIPVMGLQRDPEIYENPLKFKPERFSNSSNGEGTSEGVFYMPFGDGPRNCIGMRMGKLSTKVGLVAMLSKYNLELVDKELIDKEIEFSPNQLVLTPKNLLKFKITPR